MKEVKLIYIGEDFYWRSSTSMSSIYVEGTWERYDWGFVNVALSRGQTVTIRPATPEEMEVAYAKLGKMGW